MWRSLFLSTTSLVFLGGASCTGRQRVGSATMSWSVTNANRTAHAVVAIRPVRVGEDHGKRRMVGQGFLEGANGAEIVAGGSIHIYGTLRGRAIAGVTVPLGASCAI